MLLFLFLFLTTQFYGGLHKTLSCIPVERIKVGGKIAKLYICDDIRTDGCDKIIIVFAILVTVPRKRKYSIIISILLPFYPINFSTNISYQRRCFAYRSPHRHGKKFENHQQ